ncbi:helix-turn-helix transcriptional regulator [Chitinophaga qingshengii]|uniref:Helix-turn-helix transcriptional regulator n=1 Tax=Chitinophaga qingshengii TaxID=1569794 RepID=A0ABR7TRF3_9BACT|nr:AraC family transcriptional regulator [Chitinophaga qingshengii]MBC9931994.1 helix-turn-helix transcriptional regulator [Chitinophaga qingshengii]
MTHHYKVFIKGMVCDRCILTIKDVFQHLNFPVAHIHLGEVTTLSALSVPEITALSRQLDVLGFTLLEDRKAKLVRDMKALIEQIYSGHYDFPDHFRFSDLVVNTLHRDYDTASSIFSEAEEMTLERYIITYRIEKVKALLTQTDETLTDMAYRLGFSSTAHLSRQFKATTGFNPSYFKETCRA